MKICPKCGIEHSDEDRYCRLCGSPLINQEAEKAEEAPSDEKESDGQPAADKESEEQHHEEERKDDPKKSRMNDFEAQAREMASELGSAAAKIGQAAKAGFEAAKSSYNASKSSEDARKETTSSENDESARNAFEKVMDTPDTTGDFDPDDIRRNRGMAVVAYFGLLFLIPLILAKDSKFARFHTNQGIVLFLCEAICGALTKAPGIGWVFSIVSLFLFFLLILGIIHAAQGLAKELPIIGKINLLK